MSDKLIRTAREALEAAAEIAEIEASRWVNIPGHHDKSVSGYDAADAIRALAARVPAEQLATAISVYGACSCGIGRIAVPDDIDSGATFPCLGCNEPIVFDVASPAQRAALFARLTATQPSDGSTPTGGTFAASEPSSSGIAAAAGAVEEAVAAPASIDVEALIASLQRGLMFFGEQAATDAEHIVRKHFEELPAGQSDPVLRIVYRQAEDAGLWFDAATAPEAYLQQALRRLHAAVEAEARKEKKP